MRSLLFFLMIPLFSWSQDDLKTISSYMDYLDNSFFEYREAGVDSLTIYEYNQSSKDTSIVVKFYFNDYGISRMKYDYQAELPLLGGKDSGKVYYNYYELINSEGGYDIIPPNRFSETGVLDGYFVGGQSENTVCVYANDTDKKRLIAEEITGADEVRFRMRNYNYLHNQGKLNKDTIFLLKSEYRYINARFSGVLLYDYHIDSLKEEQFQLPYKNYLLSMFDDFTSRSTLPVDYIEENYPIEKDKDFVILIYSPKGHELPENIKRKTKKILQKKFTIYYPDFLSNEIIPYKNFEFYSYLGEPHEVVTRPVSAYEVNDDFMVHKNGLVNTKSEKLFEILGFDEYDKVFAGFIFNKKYELVFQLNYIEDIEFFLKSDFVK